MEDNKLAMKTLYIFLLFVFSFSVGFTQSTTKGNQKQEKFNQIFSLAKVYPNPVKDLVTLNIHTDQAGDIQISLINILGSEVKKWKPVSVNSGDQKLELDLSSLKTGVYIIKCIKSDQVQTQVIKKN
jgi:hypothetical protein